SIQAGLRTAAQFIAMGIGIGGAYTWPLSALWILGLTLAGFRALMVMWQAQRRSRLRALGLLSFILAITLLALALGWGRAGLSADAGFGIRYVTLAAPLLCCLYYVWVIANKQFIVRCLFALMCCIVVSNTFYGLGHGREWRSIGGMLERDI